MYEAAIVSIPTLSNQRAHLTLRGEGCDVRVLPNRL